MRPQLLGLMLTPVSVYADLPLYDIGKDWRKLGELAKSRIRKYQNISSTVTQMQKIMENINVSRAFDKLYASHSARFPEFAQELEAMALGAGVDPKSLAIYSFKNELLAVYGKQTPDVEDECSDVIAHTDSLHLNGHNEDGEIELANVSYWVKTENFEAMAYPGQLPGGAFGFNYHGIVVTMNALSPKDVVIDSGCIGKYWLGRLILQSTSIKEALTHLQDSCHTYGMSINIGSILTNEQMNIEVGPGRKLSVHNVTDGSYFHANAYLHLNVTEDPHLSPSSAHREARARELLPVKRREDVLRILGDRQDTRWPIYRTLGNGDYAVTLATGLFDFALKQVQVWSGTNPWTTPPLFTRTLLAGNTVTI